MTGERIIRVALIHGGGEPDYLYGLVSGLAFSHNLRIDIIDSDTTVGWFKDFPNVTFFNLRGRVDFQPRYVRASRDVRYHARLLLYAIKTEAKIFHVQWETRPYLFERFILPLFYKILGKKIVFTAHNVDRHARDNQRGFLNSWSLRFLYAVVDRIIVHTQKMKAQICSQFSVPEQKVSIIRHGINIRVPKQGISQQEARTMLTLGERDKVILFFGSIGPYKNVELLLEAFRILMTKDRLYKLIIAGSPRNCPDYIAKLRNFTETYLLENHSTLRFEFIPYGEVERYFMAADCLVVPYRAIFQSGVIFLAYQFGLPVIATDVGSFREDIAEGKTGFLCSPDSADDLAEVIVKYFESGLYQNLEETRRLISAYANEKYSWQPIAEETMNVYHQLLH